MKEMLPFEKRSFPDWSRTPIPGVSLSSSGLLALAELTTAAKRTALTGTSTWLDVIVLVPGLHYQQDAESIGTTHSIRAPEVTNLDTRNTSRVTNTATIHYLQRISDKNKRVIVNVGGNGYRNRSGGSKRPIGPRGHILQSESPPTSKASVFFYSLAPLLTIIAIILMVLTKDWWGLSAILWLMAARALNVQIVKTRTKDEPPVSGQPNVLQNWWVALDEEHSICLRGLRQDLEAITTGSWMRAKTNVEGYMEALAKLIVYMVAVFSGNLTQAGNIIMMVLLLSSSGLLALSNAYARAFHMNGRTASDSPDDSIDAQNVNSEPTVSDGNRFEGAASNFEKKEEAAAVLNTTAPFDDGISYV